MLFPGSLIEVTQDAPDAPHTTLSRGLLQGDRFCIKTLNDKMVTYLTIRGIHGIPLDCVKEIPTVGADTARDDLVVGLFWDDEWFVYRKSDCLILCRGVKPSLAPFKAYRPIIWSTYASAEKWTQEGVIADLQESLGNLDVRFSRELTIRDRDFQGS